MEEAKSYRAIYRQKTDEVHPAEEILQAFDSSFAAWFTLSADRAPCARLQLFGRIWDNNPDTIITEADLFTTRSEPVQRKDRYLVISRNASPESKAFLAKCLEESGIVPAIWYIKSKKQGGMKLCFRVVPGATESAVVHKANLLIDGENLLLSVRSLSTADHARMKAEENN